MADEVDEIEALRRERAKVFERITWWENHRVGALVPIAVAAFGAGYGLGHLAHLAFKIPYQAGYLSAIATLLASGRWVDGAFSVRRLDALDARIERLQRERAKR